MKKTAKTSLRASVEDLAEIDRRAHALGLTRTKYLVTLGVGRDLPLSDTAGLTGRVEALEAQLQAARQSLAVLGFDVGGSD